MTKAYEIGDSSAEDQHLVDVLADVETAHELRASRVERVGHLIKDHGSALLSKALGHHRQPSIDKIRLAV